MTITLGSMSLSDHVILRGLDDAPQHAWSQRRLLSGRLLVQRGSVFTGGRTLTLSGENCFTKADIEALRNMVTARATVSLVHPRGTYSVMITAVTPTPLYEYVDPEDDDIYSADITLIEQ